jgi:VanZ family protein
MSHRFSWSLLILLLLALLVGTQMPGAWRNEAVQILHAPSSVSSWAHFVLFFGIALVLLVRPLAWPAQRVLLAALALGLLTEGLQFFAIDRHPRLIDVGIDMAGALLALAFVKGNELCTARR